MALDLESLIQLSLPDDTTSAIPPEQKVLPIDTNGIVALQNIAQPVAIADTVSQSAVFDPQIDSVNLNTTAGVPQLLAQTATAQPQTTAAPNYDPYSKLSKKEKKQVTDLINTIQSGVGLPVDWEDRLVKLGKIANVDYLNLYKPKDYTAYTPKEIDLSKYYYASPKLFEERTSDQIFGLSPAQESRLDVLTSKVESKKPLTKKEEAELRSLVQQGNLGDYETYISKQFTPTASNLYAGFTSEYESNFAKQAKQYADLLAQGKTDPKLKAALAKNLRDLYPQYFSGKSTDVDAFFGKASYSAPTEYESYFKTGVLGEGTDITSILDNFYTYAKDDPVKATQYARSIGLDESETASLFSGYDKSKPYYERPAYTLNEVKDIFTKGAQGLDDRVTDIFTATFGTDAEVQRIADYVNKTKNTDLSVQDIRNMYSVDKIKESNLDDIQNMIQTSAFNKIQEANKLGGLFSNIFEFENPSDILKDVISSNPESKYDPGLRELYQTMLTNEEAFSDPDFQNKTYNLVAKLAPNSFVFKNQYDDKGNLIYNGEYKYLAHTPIEKPIIKTETDKKGNTVEVLSSGQYGYYNGAPILNADAADAILNKKDKNDTNKKSLGWGYKSNQEYPAKIQKGSQVFGIDLDKGITVSDSDSDNPLVINKNNINSFEIKKIPTGKNKYRTQLVKKETQTDEEGRTRIVDRSYGSAKDLENFYKIAKSVGLDPDKYTDKSKLFDDFKEATKDFYSVTGQTKKTGGWDKNEIDSKKNHAHVIYKKEGNKLIPLSTKQFYYEKPKESWASKTLGSDIGGIIETAMSIPFLPEIIAVAVPGVGPGMYAGLKGLQISAMPGAGIDDILKGAGLAYLNAEIIPNYVAPSVAQGIGSLDVVKNLPANWQNFVTKTGTNALVSAGIAGLTNGKVGDALQASITGSLISSGKGSILGAIKDTKVAEVFQNTASDIQNTANEMMKTASNQQFDFSKVPPQYKDLMANIIVDTMRGKDFNKSVQSNIYKYAFNSVKKEAQASKQPKQTETV